MFPIQSPGKTCVVRYEANSSLHGDNPPKMTPRAPGYLYHLGVPCTPPFFSPEVTTYAD